MGTEIWFSCPVCNHEIILYEGEEFYNHIGEDCQFCREGYYRTCQIFKDGKKLTEFGELRVRG